MRLLLDTHVLLWVVSNPGRLDAHTRALIADPANEVMFSAVNIWEIAIKASLRRADFPPRPLVIAREARDLGFTELAVGSEAAAAVGDLPHHHRDPFDRLLVAQAMTEMIQLYTADPMLPPYSRLVTLIA